MPSQPVCQESSPVLQIGTTSWRLVRSPANGSVRLAWNEQLKILPSLHRSWRQRQNSNKLYMCSSRPEQCNCEQLQTLEEAVATTKSFPCHTRLSLSLAVGPAKSKGTSCSSLERNVMSRRKFLQGEDLRRRFLHLCGFLLNKWRYLSSSASDDDIDVRLWNPFAVRLYTNRESRKKTKNTLCRGMRTFWYVFGIKFEHWNAKSSWPSLEIERCWLCCCGVELKNGAAGVNLAWRCGGGPTCKNGCSTDHRN